MFSTILLFVVLLHHYEARDPEVDMSAEQIITYWKYPFEEFYTETEDGYVLALFRIKHGRFGILKLYISNASARLGQPFLLAHGLGASAEHWLMNPPNCNPAFILADAGFDVWLVNFRGAKGSKMHLKPNSSEFWNFSWDQMSEFDLPAAIDTVLQVNGADRVYYVGHSQGTTVLFGKLARNPAFASKIASFFALAPITTAKYMRGPMTVLHFIQPALQKSNELFGGQEYEPPTQYLADILSGWVCPNKMLGSMCENVFSNLGSAREKRTFNLTRSLVYLSHYPGTSSMRNFAHWGQMVWRSETRMYDFGSTRSNWKNYGQSSPPVYDFTAIANVSIHLFYSADDEIATAEDVEKDMLVKHLSKDVVKESVHIPGYGHSDFIAATTLKSEIFDKIIDTIRKEDGFGYK